MEEKNFKKNQTKAIEVNIDNFLTVRKYLSCNSSSTAY